MPETRRVIHFGKPIDDLVDLAGNDFKYVPVSGNIENILIDGWSVIVDHKLNPLFRNDFFLITAPITSDDYATLLTFLPANQILRTNDVQPNPETLAMDALKNVQLVSIADIPTFAKLIAENFMALQAGYKFGVEMLQFSPNFVGEIEQVGHNYVHISQKNIMDPNTYQYVGSWTKFFDLPDHSIWEITGEFKRISKHTDVRVRVEIYGGDSDDLLFQRDIENENLLTPMRFGLKDQWGTLSFSLFVKGENIDFNLGMLHMRQSREGRGVMMIGGQRIVDHKNMGEELMSYFDAGDLKPPLNVYFSGFRPAEGFEANFMMRSLGAPFLIFGDPRLDGGAFYTGNEELEDGVTDTILNTLKKLGFTEDQLIFSGLSMGTYAALKFASRIVPHAVIVGKPLTSIGDIAKNGRIERPDDFHTGADVLMKVGGGIDKAAVKRANDDFWNDFKSANFAQTTFALSYMEDDDYDGTAFTKIRDYLTNEYGNVRILHHGLVGRHNDNTDGIVNWFLKQYHNILENDFNRKEGED